MSPPVNKFSHGVRKYVVEAREPATGTLVFSGKQPPFIEATEEQIIQLYFKHCPNGTGVSAWGYGVNASQEAICEWYANQGWFFRPKTW